MNKIKKWLQKPKKLNQNLLSQFCCADDELSRVFCQLERLRPDDRSRPLLAERLHSCQENVISILNQMIDVCHPGNRHSRDFWVKFPEQLRHDGLWLTECAVGSIIQNQGAEGVMMQSLAQQLTSCLAEVRGLVRRQALGDVSVCPDSLSVTLRRLDALLTQSELRNVSQANIDSAPPPNLHFLFYETAHRALQKGFITQKMIDENDPALTGTILRLSILSVLQQDTAADLCELLRPSPCSLSSIRELLQTLREEELVALEQKLVAVPLTASSDLHKPSPPPICSSRSPRPTCHHRYSATPGETDRASRTFKPPGGNVTPNPGGRDVISVHGHGQNPNPSSNTIPNLWPCGETFDVFRNRNTAAGSSPLSAGDREEVKQESHFHPDRLSSSPAERWRRALPLPSPQSLSASLPSSPHPIRRQHCSLPCSPLLGERSWTSSRSQVEAALQRSKNFHNSRPVTPDLCSRNTPVTFDPVGLSVLMIRGNVEELTCEEEERSLKTKTKNKDEEEEGEEVMNKKEEDELNGTNQKEERDEESGEEEEGAGIRLFDIFKPKERRGGGGEERKEEDSQVFITECEGPRYCLLSPCVCFRCPSAPPFEVELHPVQVFTSCSPLELQGQQGYAVTPEPRDRAPPLGEQSLRARLYPSLSRWGFTAQAELKEENVKPTDIQFHRNNTQSHFHGNIDLLHHLFVCISAVSEQLLSQRDELTSVLKTVTDSIKHPACDY